MPSTTSAVSFPSVPIECRPIAKAPATGPRPAMGMKIATASTSSGNARIAFSSWRTKPDTMPLDTFLAAKKPSGNDRTAPITVPTQAIQIDSSIASIDVPR
jgi:hypothetical protein